MVLKLMNDSRIDTQERKEIVKQRLSEGLEEYVNLFTEPETRWVIDNWEKGIMLEGMEIRDLHNVTWLRQMIKEFKIQARDRRLNEVIWKPEWIGRLEIGS
jgi:hypothetical protein